MAHIKRLTLNGFKSFARKTDIVFDKGINVIVGPNGSGKSNISDALCFVLGRLSIKSIRAAKARNLLFMGSKFTKPSKEASVGLVFDNSDRAFSIDEDEVTIRRIVKKTGQSKYQINDQTKTRTEIIEALAQAGIDPYGFNIVLQGNIQDIVKMRPDERRKIIEEVAGISIYESRKEKSLKELEKTGQKLKEISAILRERTAYLRNLEKEKAQAQRYKNLELTIKRSKATILNKKIEGKEKELEVIRKGVEEKDKQKGKIRGKTEILQEETESLSEKINKINKHIQQATGLEQENLHNEVANLKAELEGLKVRKEGYENRKEEIERRIESMSNNIPEIESEIKGLREKSPLMARKASELKKKKAELSEIQEERKRLLTIKTELTSLKERIKDKEGQLAKASADSESLLRQIEDYSIDLVYKNESECEKTIKLLGKTLAEKKNKLENLSKSELDNEKLISVSEAEISRIDKVKADVGKIDVCPLCQSKITENHKEHVFKEAEEKTKEAEDNLGDAKEKLNIIREDKGALAKEINGLEEKSGIAENEIVKHRSIEDKKAQLKKLVDDERALKEEVKRLEEKRKGLEIKTEDVGKIEEKYDSKILEIEEISSRTEEDVDTTLLYKERELENTGNIIKRSKKDIEDIDLNIGEISEGIENKSSRLEDKEEQEKKLNEKFKKLFQDRDNLQKKIQETNLTLSEEQSEIRQIEEQINYLKIGKAKLDAEKEALEMEMTDYVGIEMMKGSLNVIEEKLSKTKEAIQQIGSINMRALEVYESVKSEYDIVQEKVDILDKEKQDILAVIEEVDRKKRRAFMKTFKAISSLFSSNFSKLYTKGIAYLDLENKENIFEGGVNIAVKLAKGKYFDVTSLSGGEQTLVALALLFAIQEHRPYHFYILDEIDAALDKRNSERLAGLLNQYMKSGQYLIITHNDAIILNSNLLYGVSMHEGVSKILSLQLD